MRAMQEIQQIVSDINRAIQSMLPDEKDIKSANKFGNKIITFMQELKKLMVVDTNQSQQVLNLFNYNQAIEAYNKLLEEFKRDKSDKTEAKVDRSIDLTSYEGIKILVDKLRLLFIKLRDGINKAGQELASKAPDEIKKKLENPTVLTKACELIAGSIVGLKYNQISDGALISVPEYIKRVMLKFLDGKINTESVENIDNGYKNLLAPLMVKYFDELEEQENFYVRQQTTRLTNKLRTELANKNQFEAELRSAIRKKDKAEENEKEIREKLALCEKARKELETEIANKSQFEAELISAIKEKEEAEESEKGIREKLVICEKATKEIESKLSEVEERILKKFNRENKFFSGASGFYRRYSLSTLLKYRWIREIFEVASLVGEDNEELRKFLNEQKVEHSLDLTTLPEQQQEQLLELMHLYFKQLTDKAAFISYASVDSGSGGNRSVTSNFCSLCIKKMHGYFTRGNEKEINDDEMKFTEEEWSTLQKILDEKNLKNLKILADLHNIFILVGTLISYQHKLFNIQEINLPTSRQPLVTARAESARKIRQTDFFAKNIKNKVKYKEIQESDWVDTNVYILYEYINGLATLSGLLKNFIHQLQQYNVYPALQEKLNRCMEEIDTEYKLLDAQIITGMAVTEQRLTSGNSLGLDLTKLIKV